MKRIIFLTLLLVLLPVMVLAGTHYISTGGSSSWGSCTSGSPCPQSEISGNVSNGDVVIFQDGTYSSPINYATGGVTYQADNKHGAVFNGTSDYCIRFGGEDGTTVDGFWCVVPAGKDGITASSYSSNATIQNCKITGESGSDTDMEGITVYEGGPDLLIQNNEISGTWCGIKFSSDVGFAGNCTNNTISDLGRGSDNSGDGIRVVGDGDFSGLHIQKNDISGWSEDAIDMYSGRNVMVRYNKIHDPNGDDSGNGIKMGGSTGEQNQAWYNFIYDLTAGSDARAIISNSGSNGTVAYNIISNATKGIWIYDGDTGYEIVGNTVVEITEQAIRVSDNNYQYIANNILDGNEDLDIAQNGGTTTQGGGYNLFVNDTAFQEESEWNSTTDIYEGTTGFTNAAGNDFTLTASSDAVDASMDMSGNATYNYQIDAASTWPTGVSIVAHSDDIGAFAYLSSITLNVILQLVDRSDAAQASLSGLNWAFFDETLPSNFTAPSAQGSGATTNSTGGLTVDVDGTSLSEGDTGFFIVSDTDGNASADSKAFAAPVVIQ